MSQPRHCQRGYQCDLFYMGAEQKAWQGICRCECKNCAAAAAWEAQYCVSIPVPNSERRAK